MTSPSCVLKVGGREWEGWLRVHVDRRINTGAAQFGFITSRSWPGAATVWDITPGDPATVELDGDVLVTGWIDQVEPRYDATSHDVQIAGRSLPCDLVDCSVTGASQYKQSKLSAIVGALVKPFGVKVAIRAPDTATYDFAIEQGETVWEAIERLLRSAGDIAYDLPDGSLVITTLEPVRSAAQILRGENILTASASIDEKDRFSKYIVKGQQKVTGDEVAPDAAAGGYGEAIDAGVRRFRPTVQISAASTDNAKAKQRAEWLRQSNWGKSRTVTITVQGWRQTRDGPLWALNETVHIADDWLGIDRDMVIAGLGFDLGSRGSTTRLTLVPTEALLVEPPPKVQYDLWNQIGRERVAEQRRKREANE